MSYLYNVAYFVQFLCRSHADMRRNEIDDFRSAFFDNVIRQEKEKENALKRLQKNCFHTFVLAESADHTMQYGICSKCQFVTSRRIKPRVFN